MAAKKAEESKKAPSNEELLSEFLNLSSGTKRKIAEKLAQVDQQILVNVE